jgi:hypothetical protein
MTFGAAVAYQPQAATPHFVPMQPAPNRYPGPALQSENGGSDRSAGNHRAAIFLSCLRAVDVPPNNSA